MNPITSITPDVAGILADVAQRSITLQTHGSKVCFRPRSAMTPDLARRIKANRSALLVLLSRPSADTTSAAEAAIGPDKAEPGVVSVLSASARGSEVENQIKVNRSARSTAD